MRGGQFLHWARYHVGLEPARTQTTTTERASLSSIASDRKSLVETGVFEGVTALALRKVMSANRCLVCIDPFPRGLLGISYGFSIARSEVRKSANGQRRFIRDYSHNVVRGWRRPVDFIFFDGDHSEKGIRTDWETWSPFIIKGGVAAFHDSLGPNAVEGPAQLVSQLREKADEFTLLTSVDSWSLFERKKTR